MSHRYRVVLIMLLIGACGIVPAVFIWPPVPPEEHFRQAMAALERHDLETVAVKVKILRDHPGFETHVNLLHGAYRLRRGNPEAALRELSARRPDGELRAPVLLHVVESFYQLGKLAEAEMIARQLEQEQPENTDAHRWLAAIYYDLGALNSAIKELGVVTTLAPNDFQPRHLLGLIYFDSDKYAEATKHYRKALALEPSPKQRRQIIHNLAQALVKTREYQAALDVLEQASVDAFLLALKSQCQWGLGEHGRARQTLKQAEVLDPDERLVLLLKARIEIEADNPQAAVEPLQRHLDRDPHDFECRYQLALSYRSLGQSERYKTEIARMQESKELRRQLSDFGEQAVDRPRDAKIRDRVADVCDKLGKHRLAQTYRQAASACRRATGIAEVGQ